MSTTGGKRWADVSSSSEEEGKPPRGAGNKPAWEDTSDEQSPLQEQPALPTGLGGMKRGMSLGRADHQQQQQGRRHDDSPPSRGERASFSNHNQNHNNRDHPRGDDNNRNRNTRPTFGDRDTGRGGGGGRGQRQGGGGGDWRQMARQSSKIVDVDERRADVPAPAGTF
jgi:hypothetical protein